MVAIGNPESPLPEVPRFISMEIRALPVLPLIPHPTGSCRAPRERLHPGPNPEEKTGRTRHHSLEDRHTERLPSQAWSPSSPLAGKGLERGSHIPAPPVYHSTQASWSSRTKQGIASTLKKATPTMSEMESRWLCRHCWNLSQSQHSGPWTTESYWLLSQTTWSLPAR